MDVVEKQESFESANTYRVTIVDEVTGKEMMRYESVAGGFVIVNQTTDTPIGTRQGAFGAGGAIVICLLKIPAVIRNLLNREPQIKKAYDGGKELMDKLTEKAL